MVGHSTDAGLMSLRSSGQMDIIQELEAVLNEAENVPDAPSGRIMEVVWLKGITLRLIYGGRRQGLR